MTEETSTETETTETTDEQEPGAAAPPAPAPADASRDHDGDDEIGKVRKEAANYRRKLRAAEAERDKLAARVEQADRADAERQVAGDGGLVNPEDLWLAVQLDELRDDDGALDAEKVKAARDKVLADRPHWRKPGPHFDGGAREPAIDASPPSFGEALRRKALGS